MTSGTEESNNIAPNTAIPGNEGNPVPDLGPWACANHPDRETSLRCNRCGKPICAKCAVRTPIGYRCKDCISSQQKVFENAESQDFVVGVVVAVFLSFLGSLFVPVVGFFTILLAPSVGAGIAEILRKVIRKRRSKRLFQVVAGAGALGALVPALFALLFGGISIGLIWYGVYIFFITTTIYYRLAGIQI